MRKNSITDICEWLQCGLVGSRIFRRRTGHRKKKKNLTEPNLIWPNLTETNIFWRQSVPRRKIRTRIRTPTCNVSQLHLVELCALYILNLETSYSCWNILVTRERSKRSTCNVGQLHLVEFRARGGGLLPRQGSGPPCHYTVVGKAPRDQERGQEKQDAWTMSGGLLLTMPLVLIKHSLFLIIFI